MKILIVRFSVLCIYNLGIVIFTERYKKILFLRIIMLDLTIDELVKSFDNKIVDELIYLVNPRGIIGKVYGEIEGIYGYEKWEEYTASKLVAISSAISIIDDREESGIAFYKSVFDYICSNISMPSEQELSVSEDSAARVSHCVEGITGATALYHELKKNGFFEKLKPIYSTLEILTSMAIPDDLSLPTKSKNDLNKYLDEQILKYEKVIASGSIGLKFNRNRYMLNKYMALSDTLEESYRSAQNLLNDVDIQSVQKTIKDCNIGYRRPI